MQSGQRLERVDRAASLRVSGAQTCREDARQHRVGLRRDRRRRRARRLDLQQSAATPRASTTCTSPRPAGRRSGAWRTPSARVTSTASSPGTGSAASSATARCSTQQVDDDRAAAGRRGECVDRISAGSLRRVTSTGTAMVASGVDTIVAVDADGGRVAVLRGDSTVALYSQRGRLLRAVARRPCACRGALEEPDRDADEAADSSGLQHFREPSAHGDGAVRRPPSGRELGRRRLRGRPHAARRAAGDPAPITASRSRLPRSSVSQPRRPALPTRTTGRSGRATGSASSAS